MYKDLLFACINYGVESLKTTFTVAFCTLQCFGGKISIKQ